ncbi:ABC transporter permease [Candidatus Woesearchaeota archaeon]|nr:ABC transporter permease [Candidatus Woesearchaeota archaeon]
MLIDLFKISLTNMTQRKIRSWLTMIGIFIGITAVVSLISLGQGLREAINQQFKFLGTDKVTIYPAGLQGPPGSDTGNSKLFEHDLDVIKKVRGVKAVSYRIMKTAKIEFKDVTKYRLVVGLPTDPDSNEIAESVGFRVEDGRSIRDGDKYKVMIGNDYTKEDNPLKNIVNKGNYILINGEKYQVVGIMKKMGNDMIDKAIVIHEDQAKDIFDTGEELSIIMAQVNDGEDTEKIADEIKRKIRQDRNLEEGKEDFEVIVPTQIIETFNDVLNIVIYVIVGIAGISLVVGGVGIMNTMYTSILERRNEIGIMKAIGARNSDIGKIFLFESGILGSVGGIIGILLGFALAYLIEIVIAIAWQPGILIATYPTWLIILMMVFSFGVGTLFGTLPAVQAAKLNPVDALRK